MVELNSLIFAFSLNGREGYRWVDGEEFRTWETAIRDVSAFRERVKREDLTTEQAKSILHEFHDQAAPPLFMHPVPSTRFTDFMPTDLLHGLLLGPIPDALDALKLIYPSYMDEIYDELSLHRELGGQPGKNFSGVQIKKLLRNSYLLEIFLPCIDRRVNRLIDYIEACKDLYTMLIAKTLDRNFLVPIFKFRQTFDACHDLGVLAETTKVHHLYSRVHLEKELAESGQTLRKFDMNGVEALHQEYRQLQETHGFRVTKTIGSAHHVKVARKSLSWHNSRTVGFQYHLQDFSSLNDDQDPDPLPLFLTRLIDTLKEHIRDTELPLVISHLSPSRGDAFFQRYSDITLRLIRN